jgi:hypothetical protein
MIQRGYIAQLFRDHGYLEEFIDQHWPNGRTRDGETRLRRCEGWRQRHEEQPSADEIGDDLDTEAFEQRFALESQLRDFLAHNLSVLEPGLRLYESDGKRGIEYSMDGGRIDVLAVDRGGKHVVIELKLSRGRSRALGQLLYYMGWVDKHLSNPPCRGFVVAEEISEELRLAVARVPGASLFQYRISMVVEPAAIGAPDRA